MSTTAVRPHSWTRAEYDRVIEAGILPPEAHLELIEGEILSMPPQGSRHITAILLVENALRAVFSSEYLVRTQAPIALDDRSQPEPDVSVVAGSPRDYRDTHPTTVELVVEIADRSLSFDRGQKKALYAGAGIDEYWIVNLNDFRLEVWRHPRNGIYEDERTFGPEDRVAPLARPDHAIAISDPLP